jgi:hypothetical protein
VDPYGETTLRVLSTFVASPPLRLTDFEAGYLVGLLVGDGHFGGDGRQPQITLRMHVRHARIFEWIGERIPLGRLYGPYSHAGRDYYQWMARGAVLREQLMPLLDRHLTPDLDEWVYLRYEKMKQDYGLTTTYGRGGSHPRERKHLES